jgi:long-chain acyl-CoA synthetase
MSTGEIRPEFDPAAQAVGARPLYWRVEGDLLPRDVGRQVAFFAANAHGLRARAKRCAGLAFIGPLVLLEAIRPVAARRVLHSVLRGVSRDRLDFLGEEYFHETLRPRLNKRTLESIQGHVAAGDKVVLFSGWLDHIVRPLARFLELDRILCNRLEFRDGCATGRLADPVITPRTRPEWPVVAAERSTADRFPEPQRAVVCFDGRRRERLSVRESLRGREILLIGATGFIGKVWLANLLRNVPDIGRIHLLIRRRGTADAAARFERAVRESPILHELDPALVEAKTRVVEGDMCQPDLGLAPDERDRLRGSLDLIVNSGGLTEFNPDLRIAVATNIDATLHVLDFQRSCANAAVLHLSTCYVTGQGDGRVPEEVRPDYNPAGHADFDAEREHAELARLVHEAEERVLDPEVVPAVRPNGKPMSAAQLRKARARWVRQHLARVGQERARRWGWPNTYTFTKSLAESLLRRRAADLPVAIVRPSIVETSTREPIRGWNEGVNTSAPLSYLLGTVFRQLPTRERKRLDVVPVDLVTRGMTLIAAALIRRCHDHCYQLATSSANPCDMRRSIELTALAHRKHYRSRHGLDAWLRTSLETIPVSRRRYRALSAPTQKTIVRIFRRLFRSSSLQRVERNLDKIEKLIELYEPFIHDNDHVFEADRIRLLDEALPADEREAFGYDVARIDWPEYWIDIHIPALRKWSYPLIEGRPLDA